MATLELVREKIRNLTTAQENYKREGGSTALEMLAAHHELEDVLFGGHAPVVLVVNSTNGKIVL